MAIYVRNAGAWVLANSTAPKLVWAKWAGTWYSAAYAYGKTSAGWNNTGVVGRPNSPQLPTGWTTIISSAADNFSTVSLGYWGPAGGAPASGFIHRMYNSSYVQLQQIGPGDPGYAAGTCTFNVSQNTAYVFRVYSVNAAGESVGYLEARYAIGHVQQTRQDPVYGWGAYYDYAVEVTNASSALPDHLAGLAVDWKGGGTWWATNWMGQAQPGPWMMDGLRFYPSVGADPNNTRLGKVRVWPSYGTSNYLAIWNGPAIGWRGSNYTPSDGSRWAGGSAGIFDHPYVYEVGGASGEWGYDVVANGLDVRAGNMIVDIVVSDMQIPSGAGAYYGGLTEVLFQMSDYKVLSYTTVVTVSQQNNYPW